jgi:ribosomal protein L9
VNLEHLIAELVLEGLADRVAERVSHKLEPRFAHIEKHLQEIIMAEKDLADQLVTKTQEIRDEVTAAAQRILDAITAAVQASDVSPQLQTALDKAQEDIDAIKALAPATPPPTP